MGEEKALLWPQKLNLIGKNYHGRVFEGNTCRKMLENADRLLDPEIYSTVGELELIPYVTAFKSMNKIVENCFSITVADYTKLKTDLNYLKKAILGIDIISETLKIHIIIYHIEECLSFLKTNEGLGLWSEQVGETAHQEFLLVWNKYKMNFMDDTRYGENLKRAVVEFSSIHILSLIHI